MEVGPLARVLMLYATGHDAGQGTGGPDAARRSTLPVAGAVLDPRSHRRAHAGDQDLRRRDAGLVRPADRQHQGRRHADVQREAVGARPPGPRQARGAGFMEAPRGALGHWIVIEDGRIANYQAVVPSTWNAGPRDPHGPARRLRGGAGRAHSCTIPTSRSRSCAPSTASTRASPAPCTCWTRTATTRCRCASPDARNALVKAAGRAACGHELV